MIFVLNYRGCSLISRAIQAVTWSRYSHSALAHHTGVVIEAWHHGGVDMAANPWENHTEGTPVTVYAFAYPSAVAEGKVWEAAEKEVGKKYDFPALLGFLPGIRLFWRDDPDKWFCSHLVAWACSLGGRSLFSPQTPLYKISPGDIDYSPTLSRVGKVRNWEEFEALVRKTKESRGKEGKSP